MGLDKGKMSDRIQSSVFSVHPVSRCRELACTPTGTVGFHKESVSIQALIHAAEGPGIVTLHAKFQLVLVPVVSLEAGCHISETSMATFRVRLWKYYYWFAWEIFVVLAKGYSHCSELLYVSNLDFGHISARVNIRKSVQKHLKVKQKTSKQGFFCFVSFCFSWLCKQNSCMLFLALACFNQFNFEFSSVHDGLFESVSMLLAVQLYFCGLLSEANSSFLLVNTHFVLLRWW